MCAVQIQQIHDMEEVCYNKVLEQIKAGHQVSPFCMFELNENTPICVCVSEVMSKFGFPQNVSLSAKVTIYFPTT